MHHVLVAGAGKIGVLIACLLAESKSYQVTLADITIPSFDKNLLGNQQSHIELLELDAKDKIAFAQAIKTNNIQTVISSLPFFCNIALAEVCREHDLNYFDLTEDTQVTEKIMQLAKGANSAFVPQCGLAPGFISIAANDLIQKFDSVEDVLMRVGALPVHPNNALKYSLTWSTDGLINEYGNPCYGIINGKEQLLQPLEGLETIEVDGLLYEAFNTSGGLGSLADTYDGKVKTMNYKTLRYPGHCNLMRFLMNDLKLNEKRDVLKTLLEDAVPQTNQDVVLVYVAVKGRRSGGLYEETYVKKIYPQEIAGRKWSAIQVTTASSACAVIDIVINDPDRYKQAVLQESFSLNDILQNQFGRHYN